MASHKNVTGNWLHTLPLLFVTFAAIAMTIMIVQRHIEATQAAELCSTLGYCK